MQNRANTLVLLVTPQVGVWIEINCHTISVVPLGVTPQVGVWIEMWYGW